MQFVAHCLSYNRPDALYALLVGDEETRTRLSDHFLSCMRLASPDTVCVLLDHVSFAYPDSDTWGAFLQSACMRPETLGALLAHRMYCGPWVCPPISLRTFPPGWGVSVVLRAPEERKRAYIAVYKAEQQRRIQHGWRCIFWAAVFQLRIRDFQRRYWSCGGRGYLATKSDFETLAVAVQWP